MIPNARYACNNNSYVFQHSLICVVSLYVPSQPQALPNIPPNNLLILCPPFPPHPRRIHIRRTLIIRLRQHAHHAYEYLLDALDRGPAFGRLFVLQGIFAGRVQDRDADFAVGVDCEER